MNNNDCSEAERMLIAKHVLQLRKKKKISQEKLANLANTNNHCIVELEAGTRNITINTLSRIAHILGVDIHTLTKPDE